MERKLPALKKQAADALGQDVCLLVRIAALAAACHAATMASRIPEKLTMFR
jgi:hypothetical protein